MWQIILKENYTCEQKNVPLLTTRLRRTTMIDHDWKCCLLSAGEKDFYNLGPLLVLDH